MATTTSEPSAETLNAEQLRAARVLEREAVVVPHERQRVDEVLVEDRHAIEYQSSIVIVPIEDVAPSSPDQAQSHQLSSESSVPKRAHELSL